MLTNELVALPSPINCQCRIDELLGLLRVKKNKLLIKFASGPWGIWGCILHSTVFCLACSRATLPEGYIACCLCEIAEVLHLTLMTTVSRRRLWPMNQPARVFYYYTVTKEKKNRKLGQLIQNVLAHSGIVLHQMHCFGLWNHGSRAYLWSEFTAFCHQSGFCRWRPPPYIM